MRNETKQMEKINKKFAAAKATLAKARSKIKQMRESRKKAYIDKRWNDTMHEMYERKRNAKNPQESRKIHSEYDKKLSEIQKERKKLGYSF